MSNKKRPSKKEKKEKDKKEKEKKAKEKKEKKREKRESRKSKLENLKLKIKHSKKESKIEKKKRKSKLKSRKEEKAKEKEKQKQKETEQEIEKELQKQKEQQLESEHQTQKENEKERERDGCGLYDYDFLDLLDRMRGSGGNPHIPQIVLIGSRGCGKTSLLEIITGINLPKGRHNPTICPLEFNIIRSLHEKNGEISCDMHIKWRFNDETNKYFHNYEQKEDEMFAKIEDISLLNHYIQQAQNMINDSNENYTISPNSIVVNVYANNVEDIRIVDMPGWIKKNSKKDSDKRHKFYNDICDIYLSDTDSNSNNIVAFIFNKSFNKALIDNFNIGQHECIGIITGLGDIKSEADWVIKLLKNGYSHNKKAINNFVAMDTFNDYDISSGLSAINLKQREFAILSNREPWSYLFEIRNKLGSDNMMHFLGELIMSSINDELCAWKEKLDYRLQKLIIQFEKLPPTITAQDATAAISHIIHNFIHEIEKHTDGEIGYEKTIHRIENKFLMLRKEIMSTRPRLATKGIASDIGNNIYTIRDLMKLTAITRSRDMKSHDIIHGVRHFLVSSVISSKWALPSSRCLSAIHGIIASLLEFLSQKHVHQFVHFQNSIRQTMAELLGKMLGTAQKEIETMLFREKYSPIVDINTFKQKYEIYKLRLSNKRQLLSSSGNRTLNENLIEILSQSWAYFDIASNRYCDNIVMVIQSTLITSLHNKLQECFTNSFLTQKAENLETLLSLNGTQKKRKKQLVQQFKLLTNNRKQINDMIYRNGQKTAAIVQQNSIQNIYDIESNVNPLQQIQPLQEVDYNEGYEEDNSTSMNMKAMSTSMSPGESPLDDASLVPADFYSDYIEKKKQLDLVVPKLARINAQLEAQKRELEKSFAVLKMQQEKLHNDQQHLSQQQQSMAEQMEEVEKEYFELDELRDEFDKEKDDFLQQRDKVLAHIATARSRLEAAAQRMIVEREKFEQEKTQFEQMVSTSGVVMDGVGGDNAKMLQQLESQRLLMKQMRDAMINQKRSTQTDYLQEEWIKLDEEKQYIASTVKEIEATLQEIEDTEKENKKERNELDKVKKQIEERTNELNAKENKLNEKEEHLQEFNAKLQQESQRLLQDKKVNSSMYKNKLKMLKTKNKLLSSKLKQSVSGNTSEREMETETAEMHHLSLNIGVLTQTDLLSETFASADEDFYSDDLDTDNSYDIEYYQYEEDDTERVPPLTLLPHSTEEVLHIPVGDTPEPPIHISSEPHNRRSTPAPEKNKNDTYKAVLSTAAFVESPLTSIHSKLELQSNSMFLDKDRFKKQQEKRKSFHQNKAKTITLANNKKRPHDSVKLELLTDDMMNEFDVLIGEQTKISEDIQDKLHSAFQLLEIDFKSHMQKNVELDVEEYENELQQFEDAMYAMEHELDIVQQEREDLEKINEELNVMVFEMQESDRKKRKIIHKYQEQNKLEVLTKKSAQQSYGSSASNNSATNASPEIQKLNKSIKLQPNYRQYSHSSNPHNPFEDEDTDESDWEVHSDDEEDSINEEDSDRFELVANNRRELKQSLAHLEKHLHLEHGLQALALDEDEIEKLKSSHYNKQETLDKLKSIERQLDEKDRMEQAQQHKAQQMGLPPTITEEGTEFDDEDSLDDDDDSWNSAPHHDGLLDDSLDVLIAPGLVADAQPIPIQIQIAPAIPRMSQSPQISTHLSKENTIDDLIQDCDLVSVGMNESEARKILQELMNLKNVMNTPTLSSSVETFDVGSNARNAGGNAKSAASRNALQQFQHTFQSSKNVHQQQLHHNKQAVGVEKEEVKSVGGADIFPTYSMQSQSEFALKYTGSLLSGIGGVASHKQQGDMLESMVSNQIELKLQQTQLEAAMTKMELLDELKLEIEIIDPLIGKRRESTDDLGMPRISSLFDIDALAQQLQTK